MNPLSHVPYYVELLLPGAETEQEFLLLAVHAAVKKYRAMQHKDTSLPQITCDGANSPQENAC